MKRKILIGSIFAALLMLSMPLISTLQAQQVDSTRGSSNLLTILQKQVILTTNLSPFCWFMLFGILLGVAEILGSTFIGVCCLLRQKGIEAFMWFAAGVSVGTLTYTLVQMFIDQCLDNGEIAGCSSCPSV